MAKTGRKPAAFRVDGNVPGLTKREGGCWTWEGEASGPPRIREGDRRIGLAAFFWEREHGPIPRTPNGRHQRLQTWCGNHYCYSPHHGYLGTGGDGPPFSEEYFWWWVDSSSADSCWEWKGSVFIHGYGYLKCCDRKGNAHRAAWELTHGKIPKQKPELCVLHRCDNRPCVRPDHLFLGTRLDNILDCMKKRRSNPRYRITTGMVDQVHQMARRGVMQKDIAIAVGISAPVVSKIVNDKYERKYPSDQPDPRSL
jgi:hypothetical protein